MISTTKGQMVKDLKMPASEEPKKNGTGSLVALEHLKYYQIAKLWAETFA